MKKWLTCALLGLLFGCDSDTIEEEEKSEVAKYLLVKNGLFGNNLGTKDTLWTHFTYTPKGIVHDPSEILYPDNVGSPDRPFATNDKGKRIYVDENYRVTRRQEGGNEYRYTYNSDGTIKKVTEHITMFALENVKEYRYYKTGELHIAGPGYSITESEIKYNASTRRPEIYEGKVTTHLFDGNRPLKSWQTLAYHYGKRDEYALVETATYTPSNNYKHVNYYIHTYDENGLVVFTKMPLAGGGVFNTIYYYESR